MDYAQHGREIAKDLSEADLAHLIDGQKLYLNDPRKTPVEVKSLDLNTASFTVRIADLEDVGAEWVLPFWDVSKFLVERNSEKCAKADRAAMQERSVALNRIVEVKAEAADHQQTQAEITDLQKQISDWLVNELPQLSRQENSNVAGKEPNAQWSAALESCLRFKGLGEYPKAWGSCIFSLKMAGILDVRTARNYSAQNSHSWDQPDDLAAGSYSFNDHASRAAWGFAGGYGLGEHSSLPV